MSRRIAVIGGGIAGLAAAHDLIGTDCNVELFEANDRLGGKIATTELVGIQVPTAADAFLARRPEMTEFVRDLGLGDELVAPAAGEARLYRDGNLYPLPPSVLGIPIDLAVLADSGLVSEVGMQRAELDLTMPDDRPVGDESVGDLVRRRLGDEVLEYVVDPLLGGINAGDSDRLSIRAGAPQIGELRDRHHSLVTAARDAKRSTDVARSGPTPPVFYGLRGGVPRVVDRVADMLADAPNVTVQYGSELDALPEGFDSHIVAVPTQPAARLLAPVSPDASRLLDEIEYSSVAMIVLVLPAGSVPLAPAISGVLVPRMEGKYVTAISIATNKWPELAVGGRQVLRVSVGRRTDRRWVDLDDQELLDVVLDDLTAVLGLAVGPEAFIVTRWFDALPQYDVGHISRIDAVLAALRRDAPNVALAGAALHGLGLPACVGSGRNAALSVVE